MKFTNRICIFVMLCLCIFSQCYSAFAVNYVEVARDERSLVYIDLSSLKDHGGYVTAWMKWILRGKELEKYKKEYGKKAAYSLDLKAYKKEEKQSQTISEIVYGNDGVVLGANDWPFSPYNFLPLPPGTIGEYLWEKVMALTNN